MRSLDSIVSTFKVVNSFRSDPLSQDLIATLVQASRVVPYSFHLQPTHYYVITDEALKEKVCKASFNWPLVKSAPAIVVFTGGRFCDALHEQLLDEELESQGVSVEEAERLRVAKTLHFDTSPLGLGWFAKLIGAPFIRLFSSMPQLPCIHKREWLTRQVMRSVMTFYWAAYSHGIAATFVESYDEWRLKWALSIPWNQVVVSVLLIGYSQEETKPQISLPLEEILHWNKS